MNTLKTKHFLHIKKESYICAELKFYLQRCSRVSVSSIKALYAGVKSYVCFVVYALNPRMLGLSRTTKYVLLKD